MVVCLASASTVCLTIVWHNYFRSYFIADLNSVGVGGGMLLLLFNFSLSSSFSFSVVNEDRVSGSSRNNNNNRRSTPTTISEKSLDTD